MEADSTELCIYATYISSLHVSTFSFGSPAKNFCSHFKNAEMWMLIYDLDLKKNSTIINTNKIHV